MSWSIFSNSDLSRWLTCTEGMNFAADQVTLTYFHDMDSMEVFVSPVGPSFKGVDTPAKLFLAAREIIPQARQSGDAPDATEIMGPPGHPLIVY